MLALHSNRHAVHGRFTLKDWKDDCERQVWNAVAASWTIDRCSTWAINFGSKFRFYRSPSCRVALHVQLFDALLMSNINNRNELQLIQIIWNAMFYSQHFTFHWKPLVYLQARASRMPPRDFAFRAKSLWGQLLVIHWHQLNILELST